MESSCVCTLIKFDKDVCLTKTRVKGLTAQSDLVEYDTCIDLEIS